MPHKAIASRLCDMTIPRGKKSIPLASKQKNVLSYLGWGFFLAHMQVILTCDIEKLQ